MTGHAKNTWWWFVILFHYGTFVQEYKKSHYIFPVIDFFIFDDGDGQNILMIGSIENVFEFFFSFFFYLTSHKLLWVYKTAVQLIR